MTAEEIQLSLRKSPLLCPLDEGSVRTLARQVRIARWARGQVVLRKGDPGNAMMIVVEGRVKITSLTEGGRERILNIIEPGESFGEMALLDGAPRCADAQAVETTTALVLDRRAFESLLRSSPEFAQQVIADLCRRLRKTTTLVEDTVFLDPATRLARRLRGLVHATGGTAEDGNEWTLSGLSQQELADSVGLTRETVNKLLRGWSAGGIVRLERRRVVVLDLAALARLARLED